MTHRGVRKGTFQKRRGEGSNSSTLALTTRATAGSRWECPAFSAQAHGHSPLPAPGAAGRPPAALQAARQPGPRPPRARSPRTLTFCSSAEAASGTSADIALPLQTRRREKMQLPGGRGRPAAAGPPAPLSERPPRPSPPRKWPPPCDDTGLRGARRCPARCPPPSRAAPRPCPPYPAGGSATPEHFPSPFKGRGSRLTHIRPPGAFWDLEFVGGASSPRPAWPGPRPRRSSSQSPPRPGPRRPLCCFPAPGSPLLLYLLSPVHLAHPCAASWPRESSSPGPTEGKAAP